MRRGIRGAVGLVLRAAPAAAAVTLTLDVLSGAAGAPAAWTTKHLVDRLSHPDTPVHTAVLLAAVAALLAALANVAGYAAGIPARRLAAQIQLDTETRLARACASRVDTVFLDDPRQQDRLHLAQRVAHEAPTLLTSSMSELFGSLTGIAAYLVILWLSWPLMLLALGLTAVPMALVQRRMSRRALEVAETTTTSYRWRDYYAELFSTPASARDMRLHGAELLFADRLRQHLGDALRAETGQQNRMALGQVAFTVLNAVIAATGACLVAAAVARGSATVGDLVLFSIAVTAVQSRITSLLGLAGHLATSLGIFEHYLDFIGSAPANRIPLPEVPPLRSALEIRGVWFRYRQDADWVLTGVDMVLQAGLSHALVGLNGAGKSTLIRLLLRYAEPTRGAILWDGVDIRSYDVASLRSRIAGVLQDFAQYELSVLENITIGDLTYLGDQRRGGRAAQQAGIAEFIDALPHGYATMLSTRRVDPQGSPGTTLSGGQWQRMALARAFMSSHADLLILDEPNAGLDVRAEYRLHADLLRLASGRTSLLISHRLGGLRRADHIVVLQGGRVHEEGNHDQLMACQGVYATLFTLQAEGYADSSGEVPA